MRKGIIFGLITVMFAFAASAYADVQNVKVGGSIDIKGIYREAYTNAGVVPTATGYDKKILEGKDLWVTQAEAYIMADLTDNVTAKVLLLSENEWGSNDNENVGSDTFDVEEAYVKLSEFLYAPMTLTIGRQRYVLGSGLILADGENDVNFSSFADTNLSKRTAFDGIVADFALEGWTLQAAYLKPIVGPSEPEHNNIYALDAAIDLADTAKLDVYLVQDNASRRGGAPDKYKRTYVGARISGDIADNLSGSLEGALLMGDYYLASLEKVDYDAYAIDAMVNYNIGGDYDAKIGGGICFRSGDKDLTSGDYKEWVAPYEGQVLGEIFDPVGNVMAFVLNGAMMLSDDVALAGKYYYYTADKKINTYRTDSAYDDDLGQELDLYLTYNYTPDVTFGLTTAFFWPGDAFSRDDTATEIVGSMSVQF